MCNTPRKSKPSCFQHPGRQQPELRRTKREREAQHTAGRQPKRVSFSARECVLGWAQDYDRTSFEMQTPPKVSSRQIAPRDDHPTTHANFCGMWRRSHGFKWAELLEFSGLDKADIADQAARMESSYVVHLIDHDANSFRLFVHSDSGRAQDQHFFIGGQPRPNTKAASATSTLSSMRWANNGQALVLTSIDAATGDEMTVSRRLACQGSVIVQHYTARRAKSGETAEAVTIFRKMLCDGNEDLDSR